MVQNDSWEWLLAGFKIDLETQVKPKTIVITFRTLLDGLEIIIRARRAP